jgi:hypothetical protein
MFSTKNKYIYTLFRPFFRKKLWRVEFHYEREIYDDDMIYSAFITQCINEATEQFELFIKELREEN